MLSLGEYNGFVLTVNQSNVEPDKVTYHLFKNGEEVGYCREGCIVDEGGYPDDYLYFEAEKRYTNLGRPGVGPWDPSNPVWGCKHCGDAIAF